MTPGTVLRSLLFALLLVVTVPPFALLGLATFPLPPLVRYRFISLWSRLALGGAKWICGIRYEVRGLEHAPAPPYIVLAKHQSAWETLAFQAILPPQVWVLKRELLRVPLFGWGLAMLSPIAIDRSAGRRALRQMLEQGRDRLAKGFCIVIFPEGTRVAPGERRPYHAGGAWLASQTGVPVLPVAHNAGRLWPRKAFVKRPGLVTVSIGEPIAPQSLTPAQIIARAEEWIEGEMERLDAGESAARDARSPHGS